MAPAPLKAGLGDSPHPKTPFGLLWFTPTLLMPTCGWAWGKAAGLPCRAAPLWQLWPRDVSTTDHLQPPINGRLGKTLPCTIATT